MATKDPISCHVLDTLTGRPAVGIIVSLSKETVPPAVFSSATNADGRVTKWTAKTSSTIDAAIALDTQVGKPGIWKLKFDTGTYFGPGKTFWPAVEISFFVNPGEHYHVPLLLGPYSYTTYRGS